MHIQKAKIVKYLVVEVETEDKVYIIDFNKTRHHEFDILKEDKDYFYNNFNYNIWMIYWDDSTDLSIDELEYYSKGDIILLGYLKKNG